MIKTIKTKKNILAFFLALFMCMGSIVLFTNTCYALESTGNSTFDAFINDSRYTQDVAWSNCYTYVQAFTGYCFGNSDFRAGTAFSNVNEVRAGDVIHINGTHYFAVLKRSGNSLYVAEGNYNGKVHIGWDYTITGSNINNQSWTGWHWGTPASSGAPEITVGSGVFVIHSAWNDNYCLDIAGDSMESDANIQLYKATNTDVQKFRICRWYDNYSCIQSVYSGNWLDVKLPSGDNANVKLYYTNDAEENDWVFEDAGDGYVYIRNRTGYYLDVQGDQAVNNANIQLYHFVGNKSQKWRLEDVTNYISSSGTYTIHSAWDNNYCLDIAGDSLENDANIQLYKATNTDVQKFQTIKKTGQNKYYWIKSVYSGRWLDIKLPINNNSNVKLYYTNDAEENEWAFEDAGDGYVYIRNKSGFYLDLQGDQAVNNANIQVFHFVGNKSQKWKLTHAHTLVKTEAVSAKCATPGNSAYWTCSACGKYFSDKEGKKEIEKNSWIIPAKGHSYGDWVVTKEATCTAAGTREKVCSVCNDKVTETIPVKGHTWSEAYTVDKEATCTETGSESSHCTVCGVSNESTSRGIPAKGHDYGEWIVIKEPTFDEEGQREKTCSACGDKVTETIAKLIRNGWVKDSAGIWYYYTNGVAATGWKQVGGKWYLFDNAGSMLTGWQKVNGTWYYMNVSGAMATGWVKDGNTWYYMNSSGAMVTGWQKVNGTWYFFKSSGAMAASEWCDGYWLNANGSWTYQPRGSWKQNSTGWWFGDTSGWYAKNETLKINDVFYTFNAAGYWVE